MVKYALIYIIIHLSASVFSATATTTIIIIIIIIIIRVPPLLWSQVPSPPTLGFFLA